ncbi:DUF1697 domain-containing protein [Nocardioides sp.]|jgi:uncharacterized protein (DUF1697 family)|uniref:DUF1697 domain-containing protein n=1 Tax=Nocardioides sp. TaxID=35761 RepID=UPI002B70245F|nr:DUF1697 domain-containing protein [Nocardioides sp.]HVX54694.1 DUF1697 domain-containing protein [Nocardioides sp.]
MTTYVALIRGIGPGDPRKSNESLRGVLESLGYDAVRSVISSGNVVFESDPDDPDAIGDRIEAAWPELRGFTATTIVRSREQLESLISHLPFGDLPHGRESYQLVTFFKHPVATHADPPADMALKVLGLVDGALCTVSDTTVTGTPDAMGWIQRTYTKELTSRTPLTLERILKKMG